MAGISPIFNRKYIDSLNQRVHFPLQSPCSLIPDLTDEVGSFKRIWSLAHLSSRQLIWKAWPGPSIRLNVVALSLPHLGGLRFNRFRTTRISGKNHWYSIQNEHGQRAVLTGNYAKENPLTLFLRSKKPGVFWKNCNFSAFHRGSVIWEMLSLSHFGPFNPLFCRSGAACTASGCKQRSDAALDGCSWCSKICEICSMHVFLPKFNIAPEKLLAQKGK